MIDYRIVFFFWKKKKNIHFTWNEKTLLLIFFFPSFFFFFSPQTSSSYRTYISGMPRRWRTNWNLWMVLDSSSQRLASLLLDIENPFSLYSTRLDRLFSSADNTFSRRSRVVPCSLKRVFSQLSIPFFSYRLFSTK